MAEFYEYSKCILGSQNVGNFLARQANTIYIFYKDPAPKCYLGYWKNILILTGDVIEILWVKKIKISL
jgi:hypothetical protein